MLNFFHIQARATLGQVNIQKDILGVKIESSNAAAGAGFGDAGDSPGAYANAELFKVEGNIAGVGQVYINPNLNTGIGQ